MTLREFEYFLAISEEKNITKAAEKLHISQPSLTQQLQRLEKELNCKLLVRTNSGVKLTDAGEAYHRMARQMLQLYENFKGEIGQLNKLDYGTLRIGASWYITSTLLPQLLTEYSRLYPHIEIDCLENRSSILLESLNSSQIDIAFVSQYPNRQNLIGKRLAYLHLYRDEFCLAASAKLDYPSSPQPVELSTFKDEPFIMFRPSQRIRQITDQVLSMAGIRPQIRLTTYGFPMAIEQVAAGTGVAILPRGYLESVKNRYDIHIFSLPPKYQAYWDIGACYPHFDIMPAPLNVFLNLLHACLQAKGAKLHN